MIRCPRCAHSNDADATECAGCGLGLAAPAETAEATARRPVAGARADGGPFPDGTASDVPAPDASGPSSSGLDGSVDVAAPAGPAPWDQPPEAAPEVDASPRWRPGNAGSDAIAGLPPRTRTRQGYPYDFAGATRVVVLIAAVLAAAYGVFGLVWRRGIFDRIGSGADVSAEARQASDVLNGVLFGSVGLATVAAFVLVVFWAIRARSHVDRIALGVTCWTAGVLGVLAVATALALQRDDESGVIATGYVVLGVGWLLLALAAVAVTRAIRRITRQAESGPRGHVR